MKAEKSSDDRELSIYNLDRYDQHKSLVAVIMGRFFLRYLNLLYREFDGDLILPIVLGEIAHHNLFRFYSLKDDCIVINKRAVNYADRMKHLDSTNAYSISQSTGIPRETVRRKIDKLQKKGWVVKNERSEVYMSETVSDHFSKDLNKKILAELLKTSESIQNLLNLPHTREQRHE